MPYLIEKMALNDNERRDLHSFLVDHQLYCPQIIRKGLYRVAFCSGGGIGTGVEVQCETCNKVQNITDYGRW